MFPLSADHEIGMLQGLIGQEGDMRAAQEDRDPFSPYPVRDKVGPWGRGGDGGYPYQVRLVKALEIDALDLLEVMPSLVSEPAVTAQRLAVVAGENHYRVLGDAFFLQVREALDGLPKVKIHCSVLAEEALEKAIEDYYAKQEGK